eukprot:4195921-Prymnesium_polylepis.2
MWRPQLEWASAHATAKKPISCERSPSASGAMAAATSHDVSDAKWCLGLPESWRREAHRIHTSSHLRVVGRGSACAWVVDPARGEECSGAAAPRASLKREARRSTCCAKSEVE